MGQKTLPLRRPLMLKIRPSWTSRDGLRLILIVRIA